MIGQRHIVRGELRAPSSYMGEYYDRTEYALFRELRELHAFRSSSQESGSRHTPTGKHQVVSTRLYDTKTGTKTSVAVSNDAVDRNYRSVTASDTEVALRRDPCRP